MFNELLKLWRNRWKLANRHLSDDLKRFLPPALEIMETPPHPASGCLLRIVMAIVLFAVLWSVLGKVNIVSVAEGKIVPVGKVKQIQPYTLGMISSVLVTEGQVVDVGQPLIELDRTQTEADMARIEAELAAASDKSRRLEAMIGLLRLPPEELVTEGTVLAHPALVGDVRNGALLLEEYNALLFRRRTLESQLKERRAELETNEILIEQYSRNMPLAKMRLDALADLFGKKLVGLSEYVNAEIYYNEQDYGRQTRIKESARLSASIESAENQLTAQSAQDLAATLEEASDLNRQMEALRQELVKASDLSAKQTLFSPVRGAVKGLSVNTIGGIVTPAQVLMEIVPLDESLEVEAFLGNNDVGFVQAGQSAKIKVATYPFTKYGVIGATVIGVAEDATVDDRLGLVYRVRLDLEKASVLVDGRDMPLIPGMAVSAEISTGKRRIIEFVLAPLLRMKDESLRER
jgi:hemolysin D